MYIVSRIETWEGKTGGRLQKKRKTNSEGESPRRRVAWCIHLVIIMGRLQLGDFSHRVVPAAPNLIPTNMGHRRRQTHHYIWCPPSPIYKYTILLFYVIKKELWTTDRFVSTPKLFLYDIGIYIIHHARYTYYSSGTIQYCVYGSTT